MATWPATLPLPTVSGYQLAPGDQTVRSDMSVGAPRARRITAARNDQVTAQWLMDDAQLAAFRTWFEDDVDGIAGGAAWFTGLSLAVGGGLTSPDCRFVGPFTASLLTGTLLWQVTAKLEVR
jgi:hypothetical protein